MTEESLPPFQSLAQTLDDMLLLLETLEQQVDQLDTALLGGQPYGIAEAAAQLETGLTDARPQLALFTGALARAGGRLGPVKQRLYRSRQPELGTRLDLIGTKLRRLATRSAAGQRRAETLGHGLAASLQALRAMDVIGSDQLLAEA